jgi:hypothetical protein
VRESGGVTSGESRLLGGLGGAEAGSGVWRYGDEEGIGLLLMSRESKEVD